VRLLNRVYIIIFLIAASGQFLFSQNWHLDKSPVRQNLARLDMLDDSTGFAVSYDGLVLGYKNKMWDIIDSLNLKPSRILAQVDTLTFPSPKLGDIYTIHVQNPANGWMAVNQIEQKLYLILTFNPSILNYKVKVLPIKIRAFDFLNQDFGVAVGEGGGYIYREKNWTPLRLPVSVDFKGTKIVSANKIFIFGDKGIILEGDGNEWRVLENTVPVTIKEADFINENEGWFAGFGGSVMHYKDGNIEQELAETTDDLWAIDMLSSDIGFAVGQKGTILQYNGDFWDAIDSPIDADLHDLEMINDSLGFAVGGRGIILKYSKAAAEGVMPPQFLFSDQVHVGSDYLMDRIDDVYGVTITDFNNDLLPDIYFTCRKEINHLLLNQSNGYYNDYVIESGSGGNIESRIGKQKYEYGTIATDFDRDDDSDLFLAGKRQTTRYLLNKGDVKFENWTEASHLPANLEVIDGAVADLNIDGYPDFVLADDNRGIRIFINKKYNQFTELNLDYLELPQTGIRAVKTADLNGDNYTDIIAAFYHNDPLILINDGKSLFQKKIVAAKNAENPPEYINSISIADFNIDGYNDLFLCSEDGNDLLLIFDSSNDVFVNKSEEYNIIQGGRSYSAIPADFDLNGKMDLFVTRYGNDLLYLNNGNGFSEEAKELIYSKAGYLSGFNTGAAYTDIDNDGSPDLVVGNSDYWSSLLQNQLSSNNYLKISLVGLQDTKESLGAKIWLWPAGAEHLKKNLLAFREVIISNGLFSQMEKTAYFGVNEVVDLEIRFLNGDVKRFKNIKPGTELTIYQSGLFMQTVYKAGRTFLQWLNIPNMIFEVIKFIVFFALILGSVRFIERRYQWRPSHTVIYVMLIIVLYAVITIFMKNSGFVYHILPFTTVLFALLVLAAVNEPIRKAAHLFNYRQEKVNQAGMQLATTPTVDAAANIAFKTLEVIQPFEHFCLYIYHQNGNFFIKKMEEGNLQNYPAKVQVDRKQIEELRKDHNPVSKIKFEAFWPGSEQVKPDTLLFPLIRKNILLGVVFISFDKTSEEEYPDNIATIKYLFQQLAIAFDNIRIMQSLSDQEKIAAIGTFASGIIHNLKNPIDGLRMIVEILANETKESDPHKEYVDELSRGVIQLKERLLHSFDFISHKQEMSDEVNINKLIKKVIASYDFQKFSNYKLELDELTGIIRGDEEQLSYALENIIHNAVEASAGSQEITIRTQKSTADNTLKLEISDQGVGISETEIDKIFNIFYSTRGESRGLGLTITRNIIKNHNGYIDVFSELNKGTTFAISLPLLTEEE